jgi:hypothetical protein
MNKILITSILIFASISIVKADQISMKDSFTLNALYNAERCEPIFKNSGDIVKAKWANATIKDINNIMSNKNYTTEILEANKLGFMARVKDQPFQVITDMCQNLYESRQYLY